jgi:hypothetical protein
LHIGTAVLFVAAVGMLCMLVGVAFKFKEMNFLQMTATKMQFSLYSKRA